MKKIITTILSILLLVCLGNEKVVFADEFDFRGTEVIIDNDEGDPFVLQPYGNGDENLFPIVERDDQGNIVNTTYLYTISIDSYIYDTFGDSINIKYKLPGESEYSELTAGIRTEPVQCYEVNYDVGLLGFDNENTYLHFVVYRNESLPIGLYSVNNPGEQTSIDNVSSSIYVDLIHGALTNFYFYDGNNFTKLSIDDLQYPSLLSLKNMKFNNEYGQEIDAILVNGISKNSNLAIGYTPVAGGTEYVVSVVTDYPEIGVYKDNSISIENYINNINGYTAGYKFYVLTNDSTELISINLISELVNGEKRPFDVSDYSINGNEITLNKVVDNTIVVSCGIKCDNYNSTRDVYISNYHEGQHSDGTKPMVELDIDGARVSFGGAGKDHDGSSSLHMVNTFGQESKDYDFSDYIYLCAGVLGGATAQVASERIINAINDVSVEIDSSTFNDGDFTVSIDPNKETAYERSLYKINYNIKANTVGKAELAISFKLNLDGYDPNDVYTTYATINIYGVSRQTLDIDEDTMADVDEVNEILGDYNKLKAYAFENGIDLSDINELTIKLPAGDYYGTYIIDLSDFNGDSTANKTARVEGQLDEYRQLLTNIHGTIKIVGGYFNINSINFIKNDEIKNSTTMPSISNKTFGVVAEALSERCGAYQVFNCKFDGYDYAICSTYKGVICDANHNVFTNCDYAYYMNCGGRHLNIGGSSSRGNVFINTKTVAVAIVSTPAQLPAYSLRFRDNYFYNSTTSGHDYLVNQENGTLYFQENYYGINEDNLGSLDNLRTVRIDSVSSSKVITNPCIKYVGEENELGIDDTDGLYLRIFSGVGTVINAKDKDLIRVIDIASTDGQNNLGSFEMPKGGNE